MSWGTNSVNPAIYGHWLSAYRLFSLSQSRAICRYFTLSKQWQISGFKQQNSLICLILSQSFFRVLYNHLIITTQVSLPWLFLFERQMFFTYPFSKRLLIFKSKKQIVVRSAATLSNFLVDSFAWGSGLWIHNTLTMLWCDFMINKRTDDEETSVNVMHWINFSA